MLYFNTGILIGTRGDIVGASPQRFAELLEVTLDLSFAEKEFKGRQQVSRDLARGAAKFTGKAKTAEINGAVLGDLFFGQSAVAGGILLADREAGAIPATPFKITAANHASFLSDLGVESDAGVAYTKVDADVATGEYMVDTATGEYTFAAADTGKNVLLTYTYTATTGKKIVVTNKLMGKTPYFQTILAGEYDGLPLTVLLNRCHSNKLSMPEKSEDYVTSEFDFTIYADKLGNVGTWSFGD